MSNVLVEATKKKLQWQFKGAIKMSRNVCLYSKTAIKDQKSIDQQIKILKNFADQNGFKNIKIFVDNGVSGSAYERQEFKRLLKLIKSGEVSALIVKDISRLGRDFIEVTNLMNVTFPKYNVRLITVDGCIDSEKEVVFMPLHEMINLCNKD